jgi:hypothetical protein
MVMKRHLTPEQRLDLLRKLDRLRKWNSLDDEQVCVVCSRIFSGRHIDIVRDARGRYLLHCPTQECPSYVEHWFYASHGATGTLHGVNGHDRGAQAVA